MATETNSPFSKLGNPAQRALVNADIKSLKELSVLGKKEFLKLHGVGKSSLKVLVPMMEEAGLPF